MTFNSAKSIFRTPRQLLTSSDHLFLRIPRAVFTVSLRVKLSVFSGLQEISRPRIRIVVSREVELWHRWVCLGQQATVYEADG